MTPEQLHLSERELAQLREQLETAGHPDAIETTIAEQERNVANRCARYQVDELTLNRLARALVLFDLYTLVGQVSDVRQKAYENAMKELQQIQDGEIEFPPAATQPTPTAGKAGWGSRPKIL